MVACLGTLQGVLGKDFDLGDLLHVSIADKGDGVEKACAKGVAIQMAFGGSDLAAENPACDGIVLQVRP